MDKYDVYNIPKFDKSDKSRIPSFSNWKKRWVIKPSEGENFMYHGKVYTETELKKQYNKLYGSK